MGDFNWQGNSKAMFDKSIEGSPKPFQEMTRKRLLETLTKKCGDGGDVTEDITKSEDLLEDHDFIEVNKNKQYSFRGYEMIEYRSDKIYHEACIKFRNPDLNSYFDMSSFGNDKTICQKIVAEG